MANSPDIDLKRIAQAAWPVPIMLLAIVLILPGLRSFLLLAGAAVCVWQERRLKAKDERAGLALNIDASLDAMISSRPSAAPIRSRSRVSWHKAGASSSATRALARTTA